MVVGGARVVGARHVAMDQPCQDDLAWIEEDGFVALAVADGHGHKRHARSDVGAQLACDAALELLQEVAEEFAERPRPPRIIERELQFHLPRRLSWLWNQMAREHAGHEHPDGTFHEELELYGTTILAVLRCPGLMVVLQLGDGDILLVGRDAVRCAFPPDETLFGTATWSLAQADSWSRADLMVTDGRGVDLVIAATDGLRDSFKDDQRFLQLGRWFEARLGNEGFESVVTDLPRWLGEVSRLGAGDDTTVGLIWGRPRTHSASTPQAGEEE